jgi:hypothetical protein
MVYMPEVSAPALAGIAYCILSVPLLLLLHSASYITLLPRESEFFLLLVVIFAFCKAIYNYGFLQIGREYRSRPLVIASCVLIVIAGTQGMFATCILIEPHAAPAIISNLWLVTIFEVLAGVVLGFYLLRLGPRTATWAGLLTVILYVTYLIPSIPALSEVALLASSSLGIVLFSAHHSS